jgi:peptidoglycan/LPS O-acetylase OafA/YrhL
MAIPTPVETTAATPRISVFDGVRGVAIILVVLSHGWTIWPTTQIEQNGFVKALFTSGDFAVSIFFVIGAFLATRAMLRNAGQPSGFLPGVTLTRRWIRLSGQMYALLLVVLFVTAVDTTVTYPQTATRESAFRAATYTWNWYARNHALEARPDLGHLWYLSVDMQMFVIILLLVWMLRRHGRWLVVAMSAFLLALLLWRTHIYEIEGPYPALLRTWARGDAAMAGALAAAALPFLARFASWAKPVTTVAAVALIPLMYYTAPVDGYFHFPGVLLDVALFLFVVGCTLAIPALPIREGLGWAPLAFLGRHSLGIYLWHYPVFWFVARHTADWRWELRTLVALTITAALVFLSEWLVESRVQRALASPRWRETDQGLGHYLGQKFATVAVAARRKGRRSDSADTQQTTDDPTRAAP